MRTAKIFRNGQSQAVCLPKEFRFEGTEVYIKKQGDMVCLIPLKNSWGVFFASLKRFTPDFLEERHQPPAQKRKGLNL